MYIDQLNFFPVFDEYIELQIFGTPLRGAFFPGLKTRDTVSRSENWSPSMKF